MEIALIFFPFYLIFYLIFIFRMNSIIGMFDGVSLSHSFLYPLMFSLSRIGHILILEGCFPRQSRATSLS